ncbi:MAG: glycosyltransferase [Deltaproteobacteria bacterium]|nr:glycosyltransferase [Deltaproteobacteria bacterium]
MTKLKRALLVYSSRPPIADYLKAAFNAMGVEAECLYADENTLFDRYVIHHVNKTAHNLRLLPKDRSFFSEHPKAHLNYRSLKLVEAVNAFAPDLVLLIRGIRFKEEALIEVKKKASLFGWWVEREERQSEAFKEIDLFDKYFFMNSSCVDEARKRGIKNAALLFHSVDTKAFHPVDCKKRFDWCFVGGRSDMRQRFIEEALKVSSNGVIYGPKWLKKNIFNAPVRRAFKGAYIHGESLTRLYGETKVVLNITNWGEEAAKRTGMNMRVLEVPACRACLLTDGSRDLASVVEPGKHVAVYEGVQEFRTKLAHLLKHDDERERVASEGYAHVTVAYTYDHVARIVSEAYDVLAGR